MHYEGSFEVTAPQNKVFQFLMDPKKVTTIFPDVSDVKVVDESNFTLKAKIGMSFIRGNLDVRMKIAERKEPSHAKLEARGTGLSSSVDLESVFDLEDNGKGGCKVSWSAEAKISGLMASVGSRLIDAAAEKYVKQIVGSMQKKLS